MIGRKQRTRVVFIDGIPIESAILDAGPTGVTKEDLTINPDALKQLDPRALFEKYDTDGSGGIDLDEFKVLLRDLHVQLSDPKALAYFKRCDKMRRGHISFEEFRLALYTCDPKNPNRTMGFAPGQALSPKDLFDMYDRDEEGAIDRATFMEVLAFLGHQMPLDKMEGIFAAHEDPETEMMPYYQFKQVWLSLVDVRAELKNRHEKFSRFLPHAALMKKLEVLINEEEKQEAATLLEADTTLKEEQTAAYRRWLVEEAVLLSRLVLADAIDAAGQVYVFGKGAFNRFDGEPHVPDFVEFMDYEVVQELWKKRVRPTSEATPKATKEAAQAEGKTDKPLPAEDTSEEEEDEEAAGQNNAMVKTTRARRTLRAAARAFAGRQVSLVTTFLWGKRVAKVAIGPAVVYALTDAGEVFCWGGNRRQWRYFYDEATVDSREKEGESVATTVDRRPLTTRSEMLKQTLPQQTVSNQAAHDQFYLRRKYQQTFVKPVRQLPTDEHKRQRLELLGKYFDLLPADDDVPATVKKPVEKPASDKKKKAKETATATAIDPLPAAVPAAMPAVQRRPPPSYQVLLETVEPALNVDDLVLALELRGVHLAKQTRMELVDKLADCLALEIECLGAKFHAHMKQQDLAARRAKHDRQDRKLQGITVKTTVLWNELRLLQDDIVRLEAQEFTRSQREYVDMKRRIAAARQKIKRQAREGVAGSGSDSLMLNGLTSRGAPPSFFNGEQAVLDIAVGSRHALAIRQTGKLFTWGVGSFGRLGGVAVEAEDVDSWHRDVHTPHVVPALEQLRFRSVCCGFGHSLAMTTQGHVYAWGSATHGKLGIGPVPASASESFTLAPLRLVVPGTSASVRRIACGPSHSALLTTDGALFVWGSGDSGRLGLGDGRDVGEDKVPRNGGQLKTLETPTRVLGPLAREVCVEVSCGAAHTVVSTAVGHQGEDGVASGGRVFAAGSSHALGQFTPLFTEVALRRVDDENKRVAATRVSCGAAHTAVVTLDGELLTWGNNSGGCTGHAVVQPLVAAPSRVACLYQYPRNLCLEAGVVASQSSQNASNVPAFALSKDAAGSGLHCAQTQQEVCPFWQVALARTSRVEKVVVVLFKKAASATSRASQRAMDADVLPLTPKSSRRPGSAAATATGRGGGVRYVVCISEAPFDAEERGKFAVASAKSHSVHASFSLGEDAPRFEWDAPVDTYGRHVRVQMENAMGMLSLAHVGVIGTSADEYNGPKVHEVFCGEAVTVAVCRPLGSAEMLKQRWQRAVRADRDSRWVLAQLETFHPFLREEEDSLDKHGEDDEAKARERCVLCRPRERCVICLLDDAAFAVELKTEAQRRQQQRDEAQRVQREREQQRQQELKARQLAERGGGGGGDQRVNRSKEQEKNKRLRYEARARAAKLKEQQQAGGESVEDTVERLKKAMTLEDKCAKLMTMNMRTEEEEDEAEKRLAAELFAIDPIAATRAQQEEQERAKKLQQQQQKQQQQQQQGSGGVKDGAALVVAKGGGPRRSSLLRRLLSLLGGDTGSLPPRVASDAAAQ